MKGQMAQTRPWRYVNIALDPDEYDPRKIARMAIASLRTASCEFSNEWRNLQLSVGVDPIFTEWNGINRTFFDVYAVSSVEDALEILRVHPEFFSAGAA